MKNSYIAYHFARVSTKRISIVSNVFQVRDNTVPMETPQSMFEDPSNGSKTTQYLQRQNSFL